jgi:rhodanese-related sulfurtransferase
VRRRAGGASGLRDGGSLGGKAGERDFVGQIENLRLPSPICIALALLASLRSEEEVQGPDGRIPGSLLIPLPELQSRVGEIPTYRPTVVLCHSGSRSALATQQLQKKRAEPSYQPARGTAGLDGAGVAVGASLRNHTFRSAVVEDTSGSRTC